MKKRLLPALILWLAACLTAPAAVLLNDGFGYPDGALITVAAGTWNNHSGAEAQVDVAGGVVNLTQAEGEDVNSGLAGAPIASDSATTLYAKFTVNFSALPAGTGGYFAHFKNDSTGFRARVYATATGAAEGMFRLALANGANTPSVTLETDLALATAYTVVLRYDVDTGVATLWLNPTAESDAGITATDSASALAISAFALRQSTASGNGMGVLTLDDLVVADSFADALNPPADLPAVITTQPVNATVEVGGTATFTVGAGGTPPLSYVWEKETTPEIWEAVAGGNTSTLTLNNVQMADAGTYRVTVSNAQASVPSVPVTLTVTEPVSDDPVPIATLKTVVDLLNNTNNVDSAELYVVEGVVTTHANFTTGAVNWLFYLQDDTGGIAVFWRNRTFEPKAGDRIRVKAPLTHFNGLLEFSPNTTTTGHSVTLVSSGNPVPAAVAFDYNWLADFAAIEAREGRLITTADVTITPGDDTVFRSTTYPLTGPGGETFTLFVNAGTDLVGKAIPAGLVTITGVLGQFDGSNPRDSGYQILPSRYADLESANKPPTVAHTATLSNLVRPGDQPVNTFTEHALRTGETITIAFTVSDPDGKPVTVTPGNAGLPAGATWDFPTLTGTLVNGTFTYTATAAEAGQLFSITLDAANDTATFNHVTKLYVPTVAEQGVVITEFYANPTSTTADPNFNPLNRAEPLPVGDPDLSPSNKDEFIELVNLSAETVDLTGWTMSDALQSRAYVYPGTPGTSLASSNSVVLFGGPAFGFAPQLTVPAIAAEVGPGLPFSTAGLALNNNGDAILLRNAAGNLVARVFYTENQTSADSSLTRHPTSQDAFVAHRSTGEAYWSPGTQADGRAWTESQPDQQFAPDITTQPLSQTVVVGETAEFTVAATGSAPLSYQWFLGEMALEGRTLPTLTIDNAQKSDAGQYKVTVSNAAGSDTSEVVSLTVNDPLPEVFKTNLAFLRMQVDPVDLIPTDTTQLYEVEGIVTTHVNLTGAANTFFYLQDETAAIGVFVSGRPGSEVPPAGARVRIVGPLGHFNGLLQFNLTASNARHVVEVLSTGNPLPATFPLDYAWPTTLDGITAASPGVASAEAHEARLVRVDNVLINPKGDANFQGGNNGNYTFADAADAGKTFTLRIDSRIVDVIGTPIPASPVSLVGVLGQFDGANPRAGGYQLLVTRLADIITGGVAEEIVVAAEVAGDQLTLTWSGMAGATYAVRRADAPQGPYETVASGLTAAAYAEALVNAGGRFYLVVTE